jgi:hypothetical protein
VEDAILEGVMRMASPQDPYPDPDPNPDMDRDMDMDMDNLGVHLDDIENGM